MTNIFMNCIKRIFRRKNAPQYRLNDNNKNDRKYDDAELAADELQRITDAKIKRMDETGPIRKTSIVKISKHIPDSRYDGTFQDWKQ